MFVSLIILPFTPYVWCQHFLSVTHSSSASLTCPPPLPVLPFAFSPPFPSSSTSQSVIVKSVERNAVNMYEARKFLLGLESNGVSSSSPSVVLNPAPNGPSPSLICPVGLDILASAGLGLTNLGNDTVILEKLVRKEKQSCMKYIQRICRGIDVLMHQCHWHLYQAHTAKI